MCALLVIFLLSITNISYLSISAYEKWQKKGYCEVKHSCQSVLFGVLDTVVHTQFN